MEPAWPRRFLYRINPWSGAIESVRELRSLEGYTRVWLRTTEEGRVLLAANATSDEHFVAVLQNDPFTADVISVVGYRAGQGRLLKAPDIQGGDITRAVIAQLSGNVGVTVDHIGNVGSLDSCGCALRGDL